MTARTVLLTDGASVCDTPGTVRGQPVTGRDVLFVGDAVDAYLAAERALPGLAGGVFSLRGAPACAVSLRAVVTQLGALLGREIELTAGAGRAGDQHGYVSDARHFRAATGWRPRVAPAEGIGRQMQFLRTGMAGTAPATAGRAAERIAEAQT